MSIQCNDERFHLLILKNIEKNEKNLSIKINKNFSLLFNQLPEKNRLFILYIKLHYNFSEIYL